VDIYPEWTRSCILETELVSRDTDVKMPTFISIIGEVSGDKRYTNASMAEEFPKEFF
jgi:CYTH domain-containing protein